ncbi:MAG: hypothetical protein LBT03_03395 [Holosporales bacterium]|nr:hypothetical protein [Holosporales bacterium]
MINNFKKRPSGGSKQRYLRYDDVFMSGGKRNNQYNVTDDRYNSQQEDTFMNEEEDDQYQEYFSPKNNIIDDKMIRYQKRKLPPLQRYAPNQHEDVYTGFNRTYWDEECYGDRRKRNTSALLSNLWQKFIITFASILSLVCLSWIVYNWTSDRSSNHADGETVVIGPTQSSFKVLPENPGGIEIEHKDKMVYNKIDGEVPDLSQEEKLLPPQDEPYQLPSGKRGTDVEEYSILEDKIYYIKVSAGKDRLVLQNEVNLIKKKFEAVLTDKTCAVKKVSNTSGEQKYAILIGPYQSQESAAEIARNIGDQSYIISVRE